MKVFEGLKCVFTCLLMAAACESSAMGQNGSTQFGLHMDLTWNGDPNSRAAAISRANQVDAVISRNSLLWHQVEPQQGVRDWSRVDAVVNELTRANIEPLFVIYGSPSWANGVSTSVDSYYSYVPADPAAFNTWVERYKNFAAELARRYKGRVKKYELWNEENEHFFWRPRPNADQYATWYRAIYSTMKQIDPDAELALGGMAGLRASGSTDYNGNTFLKEMYLRGLFPDVVAVHPYALQSQAPETTLQWENNFTDIQLIRDTMVANGQEGKPMWATEWGWDTNQLDENTQADYVLRSLKMIAERYPFVTVATYFLDYDRPPEYYSGLYDAAGRMKGSALNFREFAASHRPIDTIAPNPAVGISIVPGSVSIAAGESTQFAASVSGTGNSSVSWSLSGNLGAISPTGLYTAPMAAATQQNVQVTAISAADASKRAMATVTIRPAAPTAPAALTTVFLSDLPWTSERNGWGPAERDMSNGETAAGDGRMLSIAGVKYPKGLGVHVNSKIHIDLTNLGCSVFSSDVGIDDETQNRGSAVFKIYADGVLLANTGGVVAGSPARNLTVDIAGKRDLVLKALLGPTGIDYAHADWAGAKLSCRARQ